MKTPGRKGETIKQEEIDKEMVRRRMYQMIVIENNPFS